MLLKKNWIQLSDNHVGAFGIPLIWTLTKISPSINSGWPKTNFSKTLRWINVISSKNHCKGCCKKTPFLKFCVCDIYAQMALNLQNYWPYPPQYNPNYGGYRQDFQSCGAILADITKTKCQKGGFFATAFRYIVVYYGLFKEDLMVLATRNQIWHTLQKNGSSIALYKLQSWCFMTVQCWTNIK